MQPGPLPLFVYGTLKTGHHRSDLMAGSRFLGTALATGPFGLVDLGGYPGMVILPPDGQGGVAGELYAVDAASLATLDAYESVDAGEYTRQEITTRLPDGRDVRAQAYVYARPHDAFPAIGGDWPLAMEAHFQREFPRREADEEG